MEAEEHTREDGNGVLLVIDMGQRRDVRVHVVCKRLVPNLPATTRRISHGRVLAVKT